MNIWYRSNGKIENWVPLQGKRHTLHWMVPILKSKSLSHLTQNGFHIKFATQGCVMKSAYHYGKVILYGPTVAIHVVTGLTPISRKKHLWIFLENNERSVADKRYKDKKKFLLPTERNSKRHKFIMSRHETVNKRLKDFRVLSETYRHTLSSHKYCFHAIVRLTQLSIQYEEPLFSIF